VVVGDFSQDVDVLVIGGGPGGYVAAIRAAQLGRKVVLAERDRLGGVCLNRGCIPSKALITASHRYAQMLRSAEWGLIADRPPRIDFSATQTWKQGVVDRLTGGVASLLKAHGVEVIRGEAFFAGEDTVSISTEQSGQRYRFHRCILATGSRPAELPGIPFGGRVLSSTEALELKEVPGRLAVIGGGYIGIELGQMYARLGAQVTILEGTDRILPGFGPDMTRLVMRRLERDGVRVITAARVEAVEQSAGEVLVTYRTGGTAGSGAGRNANQGSDPETRPAGSGDAVRADYVLVTVGRRPNTADMGLENLPIRMDERGYIEVDRQCRTSLETVYAIGDIVKGPALAHKASYEGKVAAEAIAGLASAVDYRVIPAVVFSDPELASAGMTEEEARSAGHDVVTGAFGFAANGRALSLGEAEGLVKWVADRKTGVLLGGQVAGPEASSLIGEIALALEMGATLEDVALTIHAHPTLGETIMEAAETALGRPIHQIVRK